MVCQNDINSTSQYIVQLSKYGATLGNISCNLEACIFFENKYSIHQRSQCKLQDSFDTYDNL